LSGLLKQVVTSSLVMPLSRIRFNACTV